MIKNRLLLVDIAAMTMLPHSRWSGRTSMPSGPGWMSPSRGSVAACLVWFNADQKNTSPQERQVVAESATSCSPSLGTVQTAVCDRVLQSSRREQQQSTPRQMPRSSRGGENGISAPQNSNREKRATPRPSSEDSSRKEQDANGRAQGTNKPQSSRQEKAFTLLQISRREPRITNTLCWTGSGGDPKAYLSTLNTATASSQSTQTETQTDEVPIPPEKRTSLREETAIAAVRDCFSKALAAKSERRQRCCATGRPPKHPLTAMSSSSSSSCSKASFASTRRVELKQDKYDGLLDFTIVRPNTPVKKHSDSRKQESFVNSSGALQSREKTTEARTPSCENGGPRKEQALIEKVKRSEEQFNKILQMATGQPMLAANRKSFSILKRSPSYDDLWRMKKLTAKPKAASVPNAHGQSKQVIGPDSETHTYYCHHCNQKPSRTSRVNMQLNCAPHGATVVNLSLSSTLV